MVPASSEIRLDRNYRQRRQKQSPYDGDLTRALRAVQEALKRNELTPAEAQSLLGAFMSLQGTKLADEFTQNAMRSFLDEQNPSQELSLGFITRSYLG